MNLIFNVSRGSNNNYYEVKNRFNDDDVDVKYDSCDDDYFTLRFNVEDGSAADRLQQDLAGGVLAGVGGTFDIEDE